MEYVVSKATSSINDAVYCRAQLVNVKEIDLRKMAKMLASEGSTVSESDIVATLTLLGNRLPELMALGYKFSIPGIGTFCPTVSGSITEADWRAQRVKRMMAEDETLTKSAAETAQSAEAFKKSALTSKMLTLGYKVKADAEFTQALQNAAEWERKDGGTVDEDSTETTPTTPSGGGQTEV